MSFDIATFIDDCQAALTTEDPMANVEALMRSALSDPGGLATALSAESAELSQILHRDADLTVLKVSLPPGLKSPVHDHTIWAVIGIFEGQENNRFFTANDAGPEQVGSRELKAGDVAALDDTTIHAIENPLITTTFGLHVYGGDLIAAPRHVWDHATGRREPFTQERFAEISLAVNQPAGQ